MKSFRLILLISGVLFFIIQHENSLSGNSKKNNYSKKTFIPEEIKNKIRTGDIILRSGKGFISDVFRQFSLMDKNYSHAGVISIEQDKVFVYHILGGETLKPENGKLNSGSLRKELLGSFCDSKDNNGFAVYRYDLSKKAKENIISNLQSLSEKKIMFDSHFDLTTNSAMYCTELIYKIVDAASGNQNYIPFTIVEGNKYIAPDNLYLNSHASLIYSFKY